MKKSKHLVIVAGEESGDKLAANCVERLKANYPHLKLSGIGGRLMEAAGVDLLYNLAQYGVTGFSEVFRQLHIIRKAFKQIKAHLLETKPDLLLLVDYPGFNLRLARFAKAHGIRVLYYVSPQIWAWKAGRIKTIQKTVDHMAVILPFEKAIYQDAGVPVSFVGHPLIADMPAPIDRNTWLKTVGVPDNKRLIALLPGSRKNEIERHMPTICKSAAMLSKTTPDIHFIIPMAKTLKQEQLLNHLDKTAIPYTLIEGQADAALQAADIAVVASGTASLECALIGKPMCIVYKAATLTYLIATVVIRVQYLGLCNLLLDKMIVPELMQYDFNPTQLTQEMSRLLQDKPAVAHMQKQLSDMKRSLSSVQADCSIETLIADEMQI